jgi:hypothetical protein
MVLHPSQMAFFKSLFSEAKCQIYDKAINQLCHAEQESLVFIDIDTLTLNQTALQQLRLLQSQVRCNFSYIAWESEEVYHILPQVTLEGPTKTLSSNYSSVFITCETIGGDQPFTPLYSNILPYLPLRQAKTSNESSNKKFSVAILLIDSLSQLGLVRNMPKTIEYFERLGGIVFSGHHKVGHNSYPNIMGFLAGEPDVDQADEECKQEVGFAKHTSASAGSDLVNHLII